MIMQSVSVVLSSAQTQQSPQVGRTNSSQCQEGQPLADGLLALRGDQPSELGPGMYGQHHVGQGDLGPVGHLGRD